MNGWPRLVLRMCLAGRPTRALEGVEGVCCKVAGMVWVEGRVGCDGGSGLWALCLQ